MASGVNKATIIGNVTQTPEVKFIPSGQAVCSFSVAVNESFADKNGQRQERVEFFRVVAWAKLAELCGQYLEKGRQVYVEGKFQSRKYEKDGQERTIYEIVAREVTFLGSKQDRQGAGTAVAPYRPEQARQQAQAPRDNLGYGFEPGSDTDDILF